MVYADLHVHTTRSDGSLTLSTLPDAAQKAGVEVVAVTDHDRLHPDLTAPVSAINGVTVISGVELRVETETGQRVDLLGYGARPDGPLERELDRIQRDRVGRGRAMVDAVEDHLDIDLDLTVEEGFGRPHLARAIADHPRTALGYNDAFEELIGSDGPCFVPRDVSTFETGVDVLSASCALVGLAHPLRYPDPKRALELTFHLDAVERYYPYGRAVDTAPVERTIRDHDLLPTGGSDAHGTQLGRDGLDETAYEPIATAIENADR